MFYFYSRTNAEVACLRGRLRARLAGLTPEGVALCKVHPSCMGRKPHGYQEIDTRRVPTKRSEEIEAKSLIYT